ncbi:hypothetical protein RJT34_10486 [Clitoria ternatea]|uniref:Uncharacterized protein n=1 Tax=Clitoria ternatea TaxID=43366 RepID=A0AAN9K9D4_CLITE
MVGHFSSVQFHTFADFPLQSIHESRLHFPSASVFNLQILHTTHVVKLLSADFPLPSVTATYTHTEANRDKKGTYTMRMRRSQEEEQSRALCDLSALVLHLIRSPLAFSDHSPAPPSRRHPPPQITPAGFASLLLGISLALMLCGSVTFFIGFMLMPWVLGLVMVFYVAGILSTLSVLGRSILCYATAPPSPPRKDIPEIASRFGESLISYLCQRRVEVFVKWEMGCENEDYGAGLCAASRNLLPMEHTLKITELLLLLDAEILLLRMISGHELLAVAL